MPPVEKRTRANISERWYPFASERSSSEEPGRSEGCPAKAPSPASERSAMTRTAKKAIRTRMPCAAIVRGSSMYSPSDEGVTVTTAQRMTRATAEAMSVTRAIPMTLERRARTGTKDSARTARIPPPRTHRMGASAAQEISGTVNVTAVATEFTVRSLHSKLHLQRSSAVRPASQSASERKPAAPPRYPRRASQ